jgi:PmbA protein
VTVRKKKVETIEHTRDKGLGVTVYIGQRRGHASTSDFAVDAVRQASRPLRALLSEDDRPDSDGIRCSIA